MTTTILLLAATLTGPNAALPAHQTPEWFNNARFGIFCHWGPQCAPEAGDWHARHLYYPNSGQGRHHRQNYGDPKEFGFKDVVNTWKAEKWDPDELCALYKRMGATYIQAMANHHDNFDMWDSSHQPWNSANMGPKRDSKGCSNPEIADLLGMSPNTVKNHLKMIFEKIGATDRAEAVALALRRGVIA